MFIVLIQTAFFANKKCYVNEVGLCRYTKRVDKARDWWVNYIDTIRLVP